MPMINDVQTLVEMGQQKKPIEHKQNLDAADFQRLFLEQMTHQDPMAPMEQADMMAQLSQLMEMSRNNETNELLKSMKGMEQTRNRIDAAAILGKSVTADASRVDVRNHKGQITYMLPEAEAGKGVSQLQVSVLKDGKVHQTFEFNASKQFDQSDAGRKAAAANVQSMQPGIHVIDWDAKDPEGRPLSDGNYQVVVHAADAKGNPVKNASPLLTGVVKRVGFSGDDVVYKIGSALDLPADQDLEVSVKPGQIYQITPGAAAPMPLQSPDNSPNF